MQSQEIGFGNVSEMTYSVSYGTHNHNSESDGMHMLNIKVILIGASIAER